MMFVSFNVNSIRTRLHQLEAVIQQLNPDVIGLQETKVTDEEFPVEAIHHRQHQDHDHNAQRQPEHGNQRDEGNEMISPLGAGIAQADKKG